MRSHRWGGLRKNAGRDRAVCRQRFPAREGHKATTSGGLRLFRLRLKIPDRRAKFANGGLTSALIKGTPRQRGRDRGVRVTTS